MEMVTLDREVYEKMVQTLAQLPYAQIAALINEATSSAKLVLNEPDDMEVTEDGD